MPSPDGEERALSGRDVLKILHEFGFHALKQRGSHIKLRRVLANGTKQSLTVPAHDELDRGTLHAIFRQACRFVDENELRSWFFTD